MDENKMLEAQNKLSEMSNKIIDEWYDTYSNFGFPSHQHKCTFELLNNSRDRKRLCKQWRKTHPQVNALGKDYQCDCCEMMNFLAIDEEGRIAAICHPTQEEIQKFIKNVFDSCKES